MFGFVNETEIVDQLAHYTPHAQHVGEGWWPSPHDAVVGLHTSLNARPNGRDGGIDAREYAAQGFPVAVDVPCEDVLAGLRLIPGERRYLDRIELGCIEEALDRGATWGDIADVLVLPSDDAARMRYRRLGGTRTWPPGRKPRTSE
jgi:hypothetical protein